MMQATGGKTGKDETSICMPPGKRDRIPNSRKSKRRDYGGKMGGYEEKCIEAGYRFGVGFLRQHRLALTFRRRWRRKLEKTKSVTEKMLVKLHWETHI